MRWMVPRWQRQRWGMYPRHAFRDRPWLYIESTIKTFIKIRTVKSALGYSTIKLPRNRWGRIYFCHTLTVCIHSTYCKHITNSSSHHYCNRCKRDFGTNEGLHQVLRLLPSDVQFISLVKALPEFILSWRQRLPQMQYWIRRRRRARRGKHHIRSPTNMAHFYGRSTLKMNTLIVTDANGILWMKAHWSR